MPLKNYHIIFYAAEYPIKCIYVKFCLNYHTREREILQCFTVAQILNTNVSVLSRENKALSFLKSESEQERNR